MEINLTLSETPDGLAVAWNATMPAIGLRRGFAETTLANLFIALRAGVADDLLVTHVRDHQSQVDYKCPVCKLEGKVLSAAGRHRVAETKWAAKAPPPGKAQAPDLTAITKVFEAGDTAAKVAAREAKIKADLESEAIGIAVAGLATRRQTKVELDF